MKKFMNWLSDSFAPAANKLFSRPWLSAVSGCMQKVVPFILTGSVVYVYNVARYYLPPLPDPVSYTHLKAEGRSRRGK